MITASWCGHEFEVSESRLFGYKDLSIKASSETEEKTNGGIKFVSRKNSKPVEVTLTAILVAALGMDVRERAEWFTRNAYSGDNDYITIGGAHLFECKFMLTDVSVDEILQGANGQWTSASVKLTFKQCTNFSGSTAGESSSSGGGGGGGGGSKKASVKKTTPAATPTEHWSVSTTGNGTGTLTGVAAATSTVNKVVSAVKETVSAAKKVGSYVSTGINALGKIISTAKK